MSSNTKRLVLYLVLTFVITYLFEFLVIYPQAQNSDYATSATTKALVAVVMFFPALSVLLTRLLTREGFKDCMIKPNLKGNAKYYVMAWFGPQLICTIGAVIYFLIRPESFDPTHSYIKESYDSLGLTMNDALINTTMISQFALAFLAAPLLNGIACFGEEWGWRGYMMPKLLEKHSFVTACLMGGAVWGIWHAPIIALGHNYGTEYPGFPWIGILLMTIFCIVCGIFFTWLTKKTNSCIPAVLAHGALNGFAAAPTFFIANNEDVLLGPTACGLIGMVGFISLAIFILCASKQTVKSV